MKRFGLFLILFLLFVLEGTIFARFLPVGNAYQVQIVPAFVFVAILLMAFFGDYAIRYAVLFGFLIDLVYTSTLGVYAFCMGLTVYLIHALSKWLSMNVATTLLLVAAGVCLLQTGVYVIYLMIGQTDQTLLSFFKFRLPGTVAVNVAFALIIYYPFRRFLLYVNRPEEH
ncbi:rod shape-determining protein MreD [Sporolactobacillus sp. Y61]|jgi:rod shape-determining protein MreD|uniref:Rod shape-determining protein MreD n=1 Tax=Sporolactobacillus sp. Y61 TaxID=3160863 RepID=A0AAU8IDT0_9BACL|nr:rod shape-determining protein MreD [Sporolactobacillus sp. THM19-2]RYL94684.1 rod shape-determining protein MreD [Sporolactobacillus sp. THM19-2]